MRPKRKKIVRTVTALVDADPTYVSLVTAGANGIPFNVVKQEEPTMALKIKKRTAVIPKAASTPPAKAPAKKNANNRVVKDKKPDAEGSAERFITQFSYAKATFSTEAEVIEHLEKSDFEGGYEITEDAENFIVTNTDIDTSRIAKSATVEADSGVTAVVSILKDDEDEAEDDDEEDGDDDEAADDDEEEDEESEDEDGAETTQKAADDAPPADAKPALSKKAAFLKSLEEESAAASVESTEENLQKFEFWSVYESASSDFITLLKDGCSDGLAPGFEDVMWTFGRSIRNALSDDGEADATTTLTKNATDFVGVVMGMHELFSSIVNADMTVVAKADANKADGLTKWAKSFGLSLLDTSERGETKKTATTAQKTAEQPTLDAVAITNLVHAAMTPAMAELANIGKTVDSLAKRRQVSKGIDPADATASEGAKTSEDSKKKTAELTPEAKAATDRLTKTIFAAR